MENEWNIAQSETKTAENFADFQSVRKRQTRWSLTAAEAEAEAKEKWRSSNLRGLQEARLTKNHADTIHEEWYVYHSM